MIARAEQRREGRRHRIPGRRQIRLRSARRAQRATRARGVSAFVTVQEGCDKFCTFCVVPYTRGAEVSRPVAKIVAEVERLADAGVREVTLIGQNVNAYHGDGRRRPAVRRSAQLLHRLAEVPGICRLRYTTSHPRDMDDDLIAAHRDLPALMPYVHLPVQSGSDRILAAMNRRHTRARLSRRDRDACAPRGRDLAFSSDFIVGFPGETEAGFPRHARAGRRGRLSPAPTTFTYSPRPGTPAAEMDDQVPEDGNPSGCSACRPDHRSRRAFNASFVGRTLDVLSGKARPAPWAIGRHAPHICRRCRSWRRAATDRTVAAGESHHRTSAPTRLFGDASPSDRQPRPSTLAAAGA